MPQNKQRKKTQIGNSEYTSSLDGDQKKKRPKTNVVVANPKHSKKACSGPIFSENFNHLTHHTKQFLLGVAVGAAQQPIKFPINIILILRSCWKTMVNLGSDCRDSKKIFLFFPPLFFSRTSQYLVRKKNEITGQLS